MTYPPQGEGQVPEPDPTAPIPPYGQPSTPPYSDPYAPTAGSPAAPGSPATPWEAQAQQPGYPSPEYPQGEAYAATAYPQGQGYPTAYPEGQDYPTAYPQGPGYPAPGYPYGVPARGTNTMAILALVLALVVAPAGIVLGHIAKKQIRETGEDGDGLATAGLVIGYIFTALPLLACCGWLGITFVALNAH